MAVNFILGSLIRKINLAKKHKKIYIIEKKSIMIETILKILFKKNLIKTYITSKNSFIIFLCYNDSAQLIKDIKIISFPGKKLFVSLYDLYSLLNKTSVVFYFLSTTSGILEGSDALKKKIGGELLFKIIL